MLTCVTVIVLDEPHCHDRWYRDGQPCEVADPAPVPDSWILESAPLGPAALVLAPGLARVRLIRQRQAQEWPRHEMPAPGWRGDDGLSVREPVALEQAGGVDGLADRLARLVGVAP